MLTIAVTGLNATDNPGPGVPVIRSLQEKFGSELRIIGLVYDTLEPGIYQENVAEKIYQIPYPATGLEAMFERLDYIHKQEKLDLIFSTLDTELYVFHKLASRLREIGIRSYLPNTEQLNMRAKDRLSSFCKQHSIRTPKTLTVSTTQELHSATVAVGFPCMVKGIFYDALRANSLEEAMAAFHRIRSKWGLPIILQECLSGDEFNVVGLGDGSGRTVGALSMRKLYITDQGKGWAGVAIDDPVLMNLSTSIIDGLKWRGGLEIEFMKEKKSGEYALLEINPRFPAWVYLATAAGLNLPGALVDLAMGRNVETMTDYKVGTVFVRSSWDLITDMKKIETLTTTGEV
jgi:carbamoyl-phosphate synthase large subunit